MLTRLAARRYRAHLLQPRPGSHRCRRALCLGQNGSGNRRPAEARTQGARRCPGCPPPADPTRLVLLLAIKELSNVNALVAGGRLPITETGLTVIYGENCAGKSGCKFPITADIIATSNSQIGSGTCESIHQEEIHFCVSSTSPIATSNSPNNASSNSSMQRYLNNYESPGMTN